MSENNDIEFKKYNDQFFCLDCKQMHNQLQEQCEISLLSTTKDSKNSSYGHIDFPPE